MSRYRDVLIETDRVLNKDKEKYGSRVMTSLFLKQISDTIAMIYDEIEKGKQNSDLDCRK